MPKKPKRDSLLILRILTTEELDILRLKLWKRFGEYLRTIKRGCDPDDLLRETVVELVKGKKTCPGERIDPPTCLSDLVEKRVHALAQRLKIPRQPIPNIDALSIETIRDELRALGSEIEVFHAKIADMLGIHKLLTNKLKQRMLDIFWIPEGAGLRRTSSGFFEEKHTFVIGDDEVRITCNWEEQEEDEPAYLWLSWNAQISIEKELWIIFLDPETQGIRYETNLGTKLTGESIFTQKELRFDPSSEKWAISIMLQETEQ